MNESNKNLKLIFLFFLIPIISFKILATGHPLPLVDIPTGLKDKLKTYFNCLVKEKMGYAFNEAWKYVPEDYFYNFGCRYYMWQYYKDGPRYPFRFDYKKPELNSCLCCNLRLRDIKPWNLGPVIEKFYDKT